MTSFWKKNWGNQKLLYETHDYQKKHDSILQLFFQRKTNSGMFRKNILSLKEFVMGLSSSRVPATLNHPQAKYVQQAVTQNCVVIFSKTTCPFCVQTKEIFRNLGVPYEAVELNNHPNGQDIQNYLGEVTKAKTVPRVFINGACIGGASDTKTLHKSGRLLELVSKCHNPQIEQVRSWPSSCTGQGQIKDRIWVKRMTKVPLSNIRGILGYCNC